MKNVFIKRCFAFNVVNKIHRMKIVLIFVETSIIIVFRASTHKQLSRSNLIIARVFTAWSVFLLASKNAIIVRVMR